MPPTPSSISAAHPERPLPGNGVGRPAERSGFKPGLLWLQSPALEDLAQTLCAWWARYPAGPLEEEVVLVPSHGLAEWFKAESARLQGIFAGPRVELPARFAWRLYGAVLGAQAQSARRLDKAVLPWVLYSQVAHWSQLPSLRAQLASAGLASAGLASAGLASAGLADVGLAGAAGAASQAAALPSEFSVGLYRWCAHAADLLDQYQHFRADWLNDWARGDRCLRVDPHRPGAALKALNIPDDQTWQADLWAWLMQHTPSSPMASRVAVHEACVGKLRQAEPGSLTHLPARVVLFGSTSLPPWVLDLLAALSLHAQVVLAIPNPCRVQWTDISDAPSEGQPLLSAWGKQARDFISQVERFDERLAQLDERCMARVDHDDAPFAATALQRLQQSIHLNEPLHEVADEVADAVAAGVAAKVELGDGSLHFVRAHTPLREVEILHDHLLHQLTTPDTARRPQPHDVVVMVPDLRTHAAAIRAVFGAYAQGDPRHIPWGVADLNPSPDQGLFDRGLFELADWLLSLPQQRCTAADLRRLLQSTAVRRRWTLSDEDGLLLQGWAEASGIRWGLSAAHRAALELGAAGSSMTWQFGIDRMLAGYAIGDPSGVGEDGASGLLPGLTGAPLAAVQGLAAAAAGQLAAMVRRLEAWRVWSTQPHTPTEWAAGFRQIWADLVEPAELQQERECQALDAALSQWLRHTQEAGFNSSIGYALVHVAVTDQIRQPAAQGRFRASGVTFCTLMPLRAVPFQIICLLGMDDGQYPRPTRPRPGDLMALPGAGRPGDRSRRLDDRQLLLDAVLSARHQLYISWVGQQAVDNQQRPPSVLVGQLRDALSAIWGDAALRSITADHPLQPFHPAYFGQGRLPATHVHEWQAGGLPAVHTGEPPPGLVPAAVVAPAVAWNATDVARVVRWLKCPVTAFWSERLEVRWPRPDASLQDDEPMAWVGLEPWSAWHEALSRMASRPPHSAPSSAADLHAWAQTCWAQLQQRALTPLAAPGRLAGTSVMGRLLALNAHLKSIGADPMSHRITWSASSFTGGRPFEIHPPSWRVDLLVEAWWIQTLHAFEGRGFALHLFTPDAHVQATPYGIEQAQQAVEAVSQSLSHWMALDEPVPATSRLVAARYRSSSQQPAALDREAGRNAAWRRSFGRAHAWAWKEWEAGRPAREWLEATDKLYGPFWHWCSKHLQVTAIVADVLPSGMVREPTP